MADYLDFFNVYVMGGVELLFQFCFLARILKRKVKLPFLFQIGRASCRERVS